MMNGVLNIYKEPGMTSFQVVYQIRKLTGDISATRFFIATLSLNCWPIFSDISLKYVLYVLN